MADGSPNPDFTYGFSTNSSPTGLQSTGYSSDTPVFNSDGSASYGLMANPSSTTTGISSGYSTDGQGVNPTMSPAFNADGTANYNLTSPTSTAVTGDQTNRQLAGILSKGLLTQFSGGGGGGGSSSSLAPGGAVAGTTGSASASGSGATDILVADNVPGGVQDPNNAGANSKYLWGTPEGTSALKEGLGI